MIDTPDNLILIQLREMRREHAAAMGAVSTAMRAVESAFRQITSVAGDVGSIRVDIAELRLEMQTGFRELRGDMLHLENQNISRHGETLNLFRRVGEIERT